MPRDTAILEITEASRPPAPSLSTQARRKRLPSDAQFAKLEPPARLKALTEALDRPLPPGFRWDYGNVYEVQDRCIYGCAVGLAHHLWPSTVDDGADDEDMAEILGIAQEEAESIFFSQPPETTASEVRRYLLDHVY